MRNNYTIATNEMRAMIRPGVKGKKPELFGGKAV
jgi:hypothetical protein